MCSFTAPAAGVITDWSEEDEETPTNVTVAAAIASIVPQQVYAKQRLHAKLVSTLSEQIGDRYNRDKHRPHTQPVGVDLIPTESNKHGTAEHECVSTDTVSRIEKSGHEAVANTGASAATTAVDNTTIHRTYEEADEAAGKLSDPSPSIPHAQDQIQPVSTHSRAGVVSAYGEGLVLIVEKSPPSHKDDGEEDDEDYVDDGQDDEGNDEDDEADEDHNAEAVAQSAETPATDPEILSDRGKVTSV